MDGHGSEYHQHPEFLIVGLGYLGCWKAQRSE